MSSFGISYMMSSINFSMIARNALAPVFFFRACSAMASNAPSSNSNLTSSSSNNFWYCFRIAFFGSFKILTNISFVNPSNVNTIGSLPINSGIIPYSLRSSFVTLEMMFSSLSK